MNGQVGNSPFDFAAASPLSDLFRVANAVRSELTNRVLRRYDLTWTGFIVLAVVWNSDASRPDTSPSAPTSRRPR